MSEYRIGRLIYDNPLSSPEDIKGFRLEGEAKISFPSGRLRMENARDPSEGQKSNLVYWCPEDFPPDAAVSWDFYPIREPGLCILFFCAKGINGEDIFDPKLANRTGEYDQYHHGDINAFHVSYFRRKAPEERAFHTCNLRKSYGFHLVCQGADPLPSVEDARPPYHIRLVKCGPTIEFFINDLLIFTWTDDGKTYGPLLGGGKIGFRQMAPLIAEYANFKVHEVERKNALGTGSPVKQISAGWLSSVHAYFDLCPESPDGSKALYFEYTPGSPPMGRVMVATLDADGRPVRHDPASDLIPGSTHGGVDEQWVDNDTIAYSVRSRGRSETVVYSLRDGSSRRIPAGIRMFCPANGLGLTSTGSRNGEEPAVLAVDFKTGAVRKLFTRSDALALHPLKDKIKDIDRIYFKHTKWTDDGKRFMVVFTNEGYQRPDGVIPVKSIFAADADGRNLRYLNEFGHHPMWSHDGSYAYAFEFAGGGLLDLTAYPIDGSESYPILKGIRGWHASLSPDGRTVVTDVGGWEKPGRSAILVYEVATGKQRVLTTFALPDASHATGIHPHPVWSRDGRRIYFNSAESGKPQVYTVEAGS